MTVLSFTQPANEGMGSQSGRVNERHTAAELETKMMSDWASIKGHEQEAILYASSEDFRRIFSEDLDGLYRLSLLLTRDSVKAEHCFVSGLDDCVAGNPVFREWAHSWAKRAIIQSAIRELKPRPSRPSPASPTVFGDIDQLSSGRGQHFEFDSVLRLEDHERFVFVMSFLEHYSEHDCALLLRWSVRDVRDVRTRALEKVIGSCNTTLSQEEMCHAWEKAK